MATKHNSSRLPIHHGYDDDDDDDDDIKNNHMVK